MNDYGSITLVTPPSIIDNTNITANPKPIDVSTFSDIDKNEHIPKK